MIAKLCLVALSSLLVMEFGPVDSSLLKVRWWRPQVNEVSYENFANTAESFLRLRRLVNFSICDSMALVGYTDITTIRWTFAEIIRRAIGLPHDHDEVKLIATSYSRDCFLGWQAPEEGYYLVEVELVNSAGLTIARTAASFPVLDIWFAVIGDSYVSGQGAPDQRQALFGLVKAKWIDTFCARSTKSFSHLLYKLMLAAYPKHGILFTYLACSGASIASGLLGSYHDYQAQIVVLEEIRNASIKNCSSDCKSRPDATLMGVGGNDISYSTIVTSVLAGNSNEQFADMPRRMKELKSRLNRLAKRFKQTLLPSAEAAQSLFFAEYFDLLRNSQGAVDATCGGLGLATTFNFQIADALVRQPINQLINSTCYENGWTYIDGIDEAFSTHGLCSSDPYVRSIPESIDIQGNVEGAFHPNCKGHEEIAIISWKYIQKHLAKYFGPPAWIE